MTGKSSSPLHPIDPGGFAPGTVLAGRYRIVAIADRGGMGEVYRADDLKLGLPVALTFVPPALEPDPVARQPLLAEARSARTVSHPNATDGSGGAVMNRGAPGVKSPMDRL